MLFYYEALYFGIGIEENKEEAIRYLKMSADKGYSMAMYKYANILYEQNEKKKDEVVRYLQKASDLGNVDSMVKLSEILQVGNNLSQEDYDNAYKYAKMAIENGSDKSIYWITELLDNNKIKKRKSSRSI